MYLLGIGIIMLVLKYLEFGPAAEWSWIAVMVPFGLAAVWWMWADNSGYTKRKAMEKEEARKAARVEKTKDALRSTRTMAEMSAHHKKRELEREDALKREKQEKARESLRIKLGGKKP